jgi:nucleoside-diphosphate-sugar epimerase
VVEVVAPGAEIHMAKQPVPGAPALRYVPATDRAAGLGLRPWVSLEDGVRRTCEWHERIRAGKGAGS